MKFIMNPTTAAAAEAAKTDADMRFTTPESGVSSFASLSTAASMSLSAFAVSSSSAGSLPGSSSVLFEFTTLPSQSVNPLVAFATVPVTVSAAFPTHSPTPENKPPSVALVGATEASVGADSDCSSPSLAVSVGAAVELSSGGSVGAAVEMSTSMSPSVVMAVSLLASCRRRACADDDASRNREATQIVFMVTYYWG
ncbi:hypothetical protein ACHAXN_005153 [Cyclotella atomus]